MWCGLYPFFPVVGGMRSPAKSDYLRNDKWGLSSLIRKAWLSQGSWSLVSSRPSSFSPLPSLCQTHSE